MISPFSITGLLWALLFMTTTVNAIPSNPFRRFQVHFADCDKPKKDKLEKALEDAAKLAETAEDISTSSTA